MRYLFLIFLFFLPLQVSAEVLSGTVIFAGEPTVSNLEGFDVETFVQEVEVRTDEGVLTFDNDFVPVATGQRIFVERFRDGGTTYISLYDVDRSRILLFVFLIFVVLVLALNFRKGFKLSLIHI